MSNISILNSSISAMTPVLLASLGGLFTLLVGNLNIALEGLILISAFTVSSVYFITGNILLSIIIAILVTVVISMLESLLNIYFKANIFIVALGINMFALAATSIISLKLFGHKGTIFIELNRDNVKNVFMFGDNIITYISWFLCIVSFILIYKTPFGLRLRAIGIDKEAAIASKLHIKKYNIIAFMLSGFFASLTGIYLFMSVSSYTPNISSGKGWIALVIIFLGYKKVLGVLIASFLFGISEIASNYMQGFLKIPSDIILAFPFVISLIALVIYSIINKSYLK